MAAFYRYVIAGTLRMQASEQSIRLSNDIIKKVTLGLLGVFSLFLILVTVNEDMVSGTVGLDGLRSKGVSNTNSPVANAPAPKAGAPASDTEIQNSINGDAAARATLQTLGITVKKSVCATPSSSGCTIVGGMNPGTLAVLQSLRSACTGNIAITGGTEVVGHKSHGPNKTPVDLSMQDSTLNSCIEKFPKGPNVGDWCKRTFNNFGYIFCDEDSTDAHWHIYK